MKTRETFLNRLLQTLVDEFGCEAVRAALTKLTGTVAGSSTETLITAAGLPPRKKAKPSATDLVERCALEGDQRAALLKIALRYENKQFLPRVSDVREFLIMKGETPINMKDRREAFRILLRSLVQLPVERLEKLATTALHSGPSQLGPLSDAIAAAGEDLPRHRQSDSDER